MLQSSVIALSPPAQTLSQIIDSETGLFHAAFLEYALLQEELRLATERTPTALLRISLFELVPSVLATRNTPTKAYMRAVAGIVRRTFRASDTAIRDTPASVVIILPTSTPEQARCAVHRLMRIVDEWNVEHRLAAEIVLSWRLANCTRPEQLAAELKKLQEEQVRRAPALPTPFFAQQIAALTERDHRDLEKPMASE